MINVNTTLLSNEPFISSYDNVQQEVQNVEKPENNTEIITKQKKEKFH